MAQPQAPVTISIRAKSGQRDLIDQAADRLGRSRSDFMLEAACRQAEEVLLDQTKAVAGQQRLLAGQDRLPNDRQRSRCAAQRSSRVPSRRVEQETAK